MTPLPILFHAHQLVEALQSNRVARIEESSTDASRLAELLESAQCFYAGEASVFDGGTEIDYESPFIRLPYPVTYIEFAFQKEVILSLLAAELEDDSIWLFAFQKEPGIGFIKVPYEVRLCGKETRSWRGANTDPSDIGLQWYASASARLLVNFLEALACRNVETVINEPPAKLNKKRLAQGKSPLVVFRTLHIKTAVKGSRQQGAVDSCRAGPRLHFRRGHVRRLPDKLIWVQPCVVGSLQQGMVLKDYDVSPGIAASAQ